MKITQLAMSKKKATKLYRSHLQALKDGGEEYLEDLKKVYFHLKQGRKVIDIFEVFKETGTNQNQEPKLAICIASAKKCYFVKQSNGSGRFQESRNGNWKTDIKLPDNTYSKWELVEGSTWDLKNKRIETKVPIVPIQFLPKGTLKNYYILWEVKNWKVVPEDPILLKKITKNLFVVFATWDLSAIERALIRGR